MSSCFIRERLTGRSPWFRSITTILFIIRREVRIGGSSPSLFVAQLPLQMINLQLHGFGILLMRKVALASRLAPASMCGIHTNLPVPSSFKIKKMILTLGPHRFLQIRTWTYHSRTSNSLKHKKFPTDGANCKDAIWVLSLKGRRI